MAIPQIETQHISEQKHFQLKKVQELFAYLNNHSTFYKRLFSDADTQITELDSWEKFESLPFTTKENLQACNQEFLCVPANRIAEYAATTGTLGEAVTIAMTQNDLDRLAYNESLSFESMGLTQQDIVQLILTLDRQFMAGIAYYLGLRKLGIASIRTGPGLPAMQLDIAQKLKSTAWVVVPSFLLKIIDCAQEQNINLNHLPVKKILCIGENIRDEKLAFNSLAKKIKSNWDVQLFSTYASTEMQTAFTECGEGNGAHHHPELLYVEVIDDNGKVMKPGEYGEVVITTLGIEAMPLLRYKTGDIACIDDLPCSCGRQSVRLSPIIGRKKQMIKYKGTTIYPPALYDMLHAIPEIKEYVVQVSVNEHGQDEVTLFVHTQTEVSDCEKILKPFLKTKLRFVPSIIFVSAEDIQKKLFEAGTRKAQKFVDTRKN